MPLDLAGPDPTPDRVVAALESLHGYETGLTAPVSFSPENHMASDRLMMVKISDGQLRAASDWIGPTN